MRISKAKARENRDRVVDSAARMFRERGFDSVAVADLMREAGMTHGGFYNHFGSKDELGAAACEHVFEGALQRMGAIADVADPEERAAAYEAYRRRYVSRAARDAPAPSCPMVAFAGDMSRRLTSSASPNLPSSASTSAKFCRTRTSARGSAAAWRSVSSARSSCLANA